MGNLQARDLTEENRDGFLSGVIFWFFCLYALNNTLIHKPFTWSNKSLLGGYLGVLCCVAMLALGFLLAPLDYI